MGLVEYHVHIIVFLSLHTHTHTHTHTLSLSLSLSRESVASFLTSGDLWISWVPGKDTFEELLLDYESTVSCGLWMRSSSSAFVHGPIPYYCPITFGQKIDPKGQYIKTFCPELRNIPGK